MEEQIKDYSDEELFKDFLTILLNLDPLCQLADYMAAMSNE